MIFNTSFLAAIFLVSSVSAHGVVTEIKGANGVKGVGFGVTDLAGKNLRLFNQASRYTKGDNSACGSQKLDGKKQTPLNQAAEFKKAIAKGIPTLAADGSITMTLFQVNADGAGPYKCEVSADATGKTFVPITTVKDVPGTKGKSKAKNQAFPLTVKLPAGTKCTGEKNTCLIRCKNGNSQPFGGCAVVAQGAAKRELLGRYNAALIQRRSLFGNSRLERELVNEEEDAEDVDTDEVVAHDDDDLVARNEVDEDEEHDHEDVDTEEVVEA